MNAKRILFGVLLGCAGSVSAQMVTGTGMRGYTDVFGVPQEQRIEAYRVQSLGTSAPANVLWPGDSCQVRFRIYNQQDVAIRTSGALKVIAYGTKGIPGDIWTPVVTKIADLQSVPFEVDIPAKGSQEVSLPTDIPERKGAYAFVVDLGPTLGRRFVTSAVRTFKPDPQRIQYPKMSLDNIGFDALQRLGIQAIRDGISYVPTTSNEYPEFKRNLAREMKRMKDANITVLLMVGGGGSQPLGRPRPHLDANGVMLGGKSDMAWLQSQDPDFQKFAYEVSRDFGWPKGPVTALSLWNEPWEGLSISGWGADMLRYREMYMAMARGIHQARKDAGVTVLCAGADSSSNTMDKFFSDGTDAFLPYLDAITIHYQGMSAPSTIKKFLNRKQGRVFVWDTESWVANTDDRIAALMAANRAAGYDRSMGVFGGNVSGDGATWAPAAAIGAAQHFIGEREFHELLFPKGLPWVLRFDGSNKDIEDSTLVVVGDLGEAFGADNVLHREVRGLDELKAKESVRKDLRALPLSAPLDKRTALETALRKPLVLSGGSLTLDASPEDYSLYDFYGNPVATEGQSIVVPLDHRGFFLRPSGRAGGFEKLVAAVKRAQITGIEPLEVIAHDFTAPIETKPVMRIDVTNILNVPVSGTLKIGVKGLQVAYPTTLSLQAFEHRTLTVRVMGGKPDPQNIYPLSLDFASSAGRAQHDETMHTNVIASRTIKVDGQLNDWVGAVPQAVIAQGGNVSLATAAWWPMAKFNQSNAQGFATGYTAYDAKYFYFAAKVADSTPDAGTLRFEKRKDDDYFYPKNSYEYNPDQTYLKQDSKEPSDDNGLPILPNGVGRQRQYWENTVKNMQTGTDLTLPSGRRTRVAVYVGHGDLHPNGLVARILDPVTGNVLAETNWNKLWDGTYLVFEATGKIRLQLRTNGDFYTAKAYCFLFNDAGPATFAASSFAVMDFDTKSDWRTKYGQLGYYFVNGPQKLPAGLTVKPYESIKRTTYTWPDGSRQFSYRQWPVLPIPYESASYDCVQIAFNALPEDQKWMKMNPPGVPAHFVDYPSTDYEYSLNKVASQYGGGTEVWRVLAPGMPRKHFYPRQPKSPIDGPVKNAKLAITHQGSTRIVEVAIPWSEIPAVKKRLDAHQTVKFTFRVTDSSLNAKPELGANRSVAKASGLTFHVDWNTGWANEVEFGFAQSGKK